MNDIVYQLYEEGFAIFLGDVRISYWKPLRAGLWWKMPAIHIEFPSAPL
jgi:hypothetical protein